MNTNSNFLVLSAYPTSTASREIDTVSIKNASTSSKLLIGTLMDMIQPVFMATSEFQYSRKSILVMFLAFSAEQYSNARQKNWW